MKLSKALKLKNRLAGELARLKAIVQTKNVSEVGQTITYNVKDIFTNKLALAMRNLVIVKTAIAIQNATDVHLGNPRISNFTLKDLMETPYWNIFLMAELKGMIELLKGIDTKDGKHSTSNPYGQTASSVEYVAQLKQKDVDSAIAVF